MYNNAQNEQPAATTAATPTLHLGPTRRAILRLIVGNELFTAAEQAKAHRSVHECENTQRLALWLKNVTRVLAERVEREAAQDTALALADSQAFAPVTVTGATAAQASEIHSLALHRVITKGERAKALLALPTLDTVRATALIGELWAKVLYRSESDTTGQYVSTSLTA